MVLSGTDKKILETLFDMRGGYVLDFSNRTMEEFFRDNFGIAIYDKKYDVENLTDSKANRLRGIWAKEDEQTVGMIIQSLTEYMEISSLTSDKEISQNTILLTQKARDIAKRLLVVSSDQAEVNKLTEKAIALKNFNGLSFTELSLNEKIYLLKVLWSFYEGIVRSYYGDGVIFLGSGIDDLNDSFKTLRKKMIELIASDTSFEELRETECYQAIIDPMGSLYFSSDFLDGAWEDAVERYLVNFREMIADRDLFENASEAHKLHSSIAQFLAFVKKEISELIDTVREQRVMFDRRYSPRNSEDSKEKTIKHEHRHIFENSAQEKDININLKTEKGSSERKNKFPYKLPSGTKWENITLKFLNDEEILILVQGKEHIAKYDEIGFSTDKGKPSVVWSFLKVLGKQNGEIAMTDKSANTKYKKQKQQVLDILQRYFSLDTDPFYPYKDTKSYKTKFTIFIDESLRENTPTKTQGENNDDLDPFADLSDAYSESTPGIRENEIF